MDLSALYITGICVGGFIVAIGGVMMLVAAFRQSILWGLGYLFIPFVSLLFVGIHWAAAKRGFLTSLVGGLILVGSLVPLAQTPQFQELVTKNESGFNLPAAIAGKAKPTVETPKSPDLTGEIQKKRDLLEGLEPQLAGAVAQVARQFTELEAKRKKLKPDDGAAINQFNAMAGVYQAKNAEAKEVQRKITTLNEELNQLLAERSRMRAASTPGSSGGGEHRVVMYTTSSCPACKSAKQHLARRGIPFEELDVEQSPKARAEYERLGGQGVPIILVGDKRLDGFDPGALDAML